MSNDDIYLGKRIGILRSQIFRLQRIRYASSVHLTVEEAIILNMIKAKGTLIMQDVALVTGKNKSVVMRMINSLEKKGFLERITNNEDRREKFLHLTSEGELVVDQYRAVEKQLTSDLLAEASEEDIKAFCRVINIIGKNSEMLLKK